MEGAGAVRRFAAATVFPRPALQGSDRGRHLAGWGDGQQVPRPVVPGGGGGGTHPADRGSPVVLSLALSRGLLRAPPEAS
jgi:hypothetical protein